MRNAQIHIGENVAVLFIFFILLIVSLVFYARLSASTMSTKTEEDFQKRALEISQRIAYLPEVQCSTQNNCYDLQKLRALSQINKDAANINHYYSMFGYSDVIIEEVFPEQMTIGTLYSDQPNKVTENQSLQIPVSVCDFTYNPEGDCLFGVMTVHVYK